MAVCSSWGYSAMIASNLPDPFTHSAAIRSTGMTGNGQPYRRGGDERAPIICSARDSRAPPQIAAYLRDLLTQEAALPPVEDVMAGIASREPVAYAMDDLRSFARDGRR